MLDRWKVARWIQRWDHQQEHYAEHREARFTAMIDIVARTTAAHPRPVVVDIGAGPGSLAVRLGKALPGARVVAVESDPVLVGLGRAAYGDRVEFAVETAGSPRWRERLGLPEVHAVVASSALHYPPADRLRELYVDIHDWLAAGGVLVNGDHFGDLTQNASPGEPGPGIEEWATWWRDAAADEDLAPLFALRAANSWAPPEDEGDNGLTASQHVALLRSVGFRRAALTWDRGRSGIIVAAP